VRFQIIESFSRGNKGRHQVEVLKSKDGTVSLSIHTGINSVPVDTWDKVKDGDAAKRLLEAKTIVDKGISQDEHKADEAQQEARLLQQEGKQLQLAGDGADASANKG
jgi:hypothetical protein